MDRRLPFCDRRKESVLVQYLSHTGLVCGAWILVVDHNERGSVHPCMCDTVHHIGGTRPSGRDADTRRPGNLTPCGGHHGTGGLLLHQDKAHLAVARGIHQLDCLSTWMTDDEGGSHLVESLAEDFYGCRHINLFLLPSADRFQ